MHSHHFIQSLEFLKNKELREIYISLAIKTLAISMIGIFIPIFLIKELGYPIMDMIKFFLIFALTSFFMACFVGKLTATIGTKKLLAISITFHVVGYFFMYYYLDSIYKLFLIAAILGAADNMYGVGIVSNFARTSDRKHRSEEVSMLYSSIILGGVIGPLVGGTLITIYGFNILFGIVVVLLFLSLLPLFKIKEVHTPYTYNFKHILNELTISNLKKSYGLLAIGFRQIADFILWPVFLFSVLGLYLSLGIVFTLGMLLMGIMNIFIGEYIKKKGKKATTKTHHIGCILHACSWFLRVLAKAPTPISAFTIIGMVSTPIIDVPFNTLFFNKNMRRGKALEVAVHRNMSYSLGMVIILIFMLIFESFISSFVFAGVSSLLHIFF